MVVLDSIQLVVHAILVLSIYNLTGFIAIYVPFLFRIHFLLAPKWVKIEF